MMIKYLANLPEIMVLQLSICSEMHGLNKLKFLKNQLKVFSEGQIYFEFAIPRMGKRVDNILNY